MTIPDDLIKPTEAAELLRVTPRTVRNWLIEGQLVGYRLSARAWRISRRDLADFIDANRTFPRDDEGRATTRPSVITPAGTGGGRDAD